MKTSDIHTEILKKGDLTEDEIKSLSNLINATYLDTEKDYWPHNGTYERINVNTLKEYISIKNIIAAYYQNKIVGAVHTYKLDDITCGFGMLVTKKELRNLGIGTKLLTAVEEWAKHKDVKIIQLELLKPQNYIDKNKEFLKKWYQQIGYKYIESATYKKLYPKQASLLKIPCIFEIYQKNI